MKTILNKKSMFLFMYMPLLFGVVAGSVFFLYFALHDFNLEECGILKFSMKEVFSLTDLQLLVLLLKKRVCQFFFVFIILNIIPYAIVLSSGSALFGGYYSYVASQLFYQYGWKGMVYGLLCFYPHYLCYGISFYLIGKWFLFFPENDRLKKNNVKNAQYFFKIFVIFLLLLLGVFWEIKFQKNILKNFYQYLVP